MKNINLKIDDLILPISNYYEQTEYDRGIISLLFTVYDKDLRANNITYEELVNRFKNKESYDVSLLRKDDNSVIIKFEGYGKAEINRTINSYGDLMISIRMEKQIQ